MGIVLVFSGSGLLATAFRCALPTPWRAVSYAVCPSARSIYLYNGITDVITDALLCLLAVAMVWNVKTDKKRKATVVALFTCRIL